MALRVYNTLSQAKEPFQTVTPGRVGMYVCGPTVYSKSHIGHMVGPVIFDTIKRYLTYLGYQVSWVVNITDVDDKLIIQAQKDGTTVKELAEQVTADYLDCLAALSVDGIDHMPRATEHIGEIVTITSGLIEKGFAYESGGDVYFDVNKAESYGKLSHRDPDDLLAGARIEPTTLKRNPGDFALWKRSKPRPMPALWQASRALSNGASWFAQLLLRTMMASTKPPVTAFWRISACCAWWHEKPTNLALPDFRMASAVSLNSRLLGHSISLVMSLSPTAWMKIRST